MDDEMSIDFYLIIPSQQRCFIRGALIYGACLETTLLMRRRTHGLTHAVIFRHRIMRQPSPEADIIVCC